MPSSDTEPTDDVEGVDDGLENAAGHDPEADPEQQGADAASPLAAAEERVVPDADDDEEHVEIAERAVSNAVEATTEEPAAACETTPVSDAVVVTDAVDIPESKPDSNEDVGRAADSSEHRSEVQKASNLNEHEIQPSPEAGVSTDFNAADDWGDFTSIDDSKNPPELRPVNNESRNDWGDFTTTSSHGPDDTNAFQASFDQAPAETNDDWGDFTTDDQKANQPADEHDWSSFTKPAAVAPQVDIFELPAAELQAAISKCLSDILPEDMLMKVSDPPSEFVLPSGVTFDSILRKPDTEGSQTQPGALTIEIESKCIFYGSPLCEMVFADIAGVETPVAPFQAQKKKFCLNATPTPSSASLWQMDQTSNDAVSNETAPDIPDLSYMTSTTLKD